jgi:23S rRNA (cytidine1920-2'-O)/16S rRNA (cytidine1409-2'-O)-methyltransferase
VDVVGKICLDAGASTGGFTDCLLQRGAARVAAVDVGYGQLDWALRSDERVTVLERTNVRFLESGDLPGTPELIVADLSFVSLRTAVPALAGLLGERGSLLLLVKPQFEAPPDLVGEGGVVSDPAVWASCIERVADACVAAGTYPQGVMASPLTGPAGNVEFFLISGTGRSEGMDVSSAVAEGESLIAGSG